MFAFDSLLSGFSVFQTGFTHVFQLATEHFTSVCFCIARALGALHASASGGGPQTFSVDFH